MKFDNKKYMDFEEGNKINKLGLKNFKLKYMKVPKNKKLRKCLMELEKYNMEIIDESFYNRMNLHINKNRLITILFEYIK